MSRYAPRDPRLSKTLRELVTEHQDGEEKVIMVSTDHTVIAILGRDAIAKGAHRAFAVEAQVRGELRAIAHLGLYGVQKTMINVFTPDGGETLHMAYFTPPRTVRWVPVSNKAKDLWQKAWGQQAPAEQREKG